MLLDEDGKIVLGKGVQLNPYRPRPKIHRQFMTDGEIINGAGGDLIVDTESFANYYLCGFKHVQSGKYIRIDGEFNPRFLSWLMFSYRTVGFNSIDYDLVMIWASYVNSNPEFLKEVSNDLIVYGERAADVARKYGFQRFELPYMQHIDLINVCPLKGSLKLYGARLHSQRIQELPIPDTKHLSESEIEDVVDYNCNDLDVTEHIFNFCKERIELRQAISIEYGEDLLSKSDAQMAEVVISKEVGKLNGKWVKRPEIEAGTIFKYRVPNYLQFATEPLQKLLTKVKNANFILNEDGKIIPPSELSEPVKVGHNYYSVGIGGLHSKDKCKAFKAINGYKLKDIDVTSYYPNAILNMNLYPIAMGPNFITVYKGFKDQRVEAKRTKQFTKDKGLKIFLNGVSGKFSDKWSKMYSPGHTIQMNLTGQLSILMLAEMFECQGFEVVSANTDGLVVYYKEEFEEQVKYWIKYWETITNFQLEDVEYSAYYARDVNAYFAVKSNGEVKVKGPYSEVGSQSGTQLDNNPITLICSDAIKLYLGKGVPYEETIKNCKDITRFVVVRNVKGGAAFRNDYLGKVVRWYHSTKSHDHIKYVTTGNKVADSDNCIPCMDLPTNIPDDLDYQFYIDKAREILYDVGYYERPKQMEFF